MAVGIPGVHYHIGIATRNLDEGMAAVGSALGLTWAGVQEGEAPPLSSPEGRVTWTLQRVVHSMGGPMRVELLEGGPGSVWDTDEVARLHHVAYWVDDVGAAVTLLADDGWTLEVTVPDDAGRPSMFAYMTKPGNARVELTDAVRRDATLDRLGWSQWRDYLR